jgi:hypothetical protein
MLVELEAEGGDVIAGVVSRGASEEVLAETMRSGECE